MVQAPQAHGAEQKLRASVRGFYFTQFREAKYKVSTAMTNKIRRVRGLLTISVKVCSFIGFAFFCWWHFVEFS